LLPNVEKDLTQEVFGQGFVPYEPKQPAIEGNAMPREKRSHGKLVALCDSSD
jgi:hypothetical protein